MNVKYVCKVLDIGYTLKSEAKLHEAKISSQW